MTLREAVQYTITVDAGRGDYELPEGPYYEGRDYELYIKNLKRPLSAFSYRYTMSWPKLDKTTDDRGYQIYISIGQSF